MYHNVFCSHDGCTYVLYHCDCPISKNHTGSLCPKHQTPEERAIRAKVHAEIQEEYRRFGWPAPQ